MATQPTRLLSLHVDAYHSILHRFRAALKEEVRALIATNAIFASWEDAKIEHLASLVVIKQFAANAEIMGANKPVPALMLVKSGIVTLLKAVPRRLLRTPSASTASTSSSKASQSKNETMKGTARKKVSPNAAATNSKVIQTSGSSTLFAGETPGLWIVNKGWTTHLDEQIMREHTQYILDQRAKTGNGLLSSLEQQQQQQQQQNHHNNNSNGNNAIHNSSSNHNNSTRPPSSSLTTPAAVSGSVPINATTGLPQLDASELDLAELAVGVLGSGQVFGELAVLDPQQPSPVSALASTAVELFCFESDVLAALGARFYGGTMRTLLESIALHDPPLDKIGFFFRQKFSWEQHKQRLMQRLQQKQKPPRPTKTLIASASTTSLTGPTSQSQSQSLSLPPIVKK
jgi:CRP-like cAMP-binding protein